MSMSIPELGMSPARVAPVRHLIRGSCPTRNIKGSVHRHCSDSPRTYRQNIGRLDSQVHMG